MTDGEVRWGILGTAKITEVEMGPALAKVPRSRIAAIGSRRRPAAQALRDSLGTPGAAAYGSYQEVLDDPEVDAVYIPLPNTQHAEWTLAALTAGKHVLCEKPMAWTDVEAREVAAAAASAQKVLLEGFMYRFHPRIARVRQLLADGVIGDVALVRTTYTFDLGQAGDVRSGTVDEDIRMRADVGGGALSDLGSYCGNALRLYAGARPTTIVSSRTSAPGREVETRVWGEVGFENGVVGQFFAALDLPGGGHVEILGSKGRIRLRNAFRIRAEQGPVAIEILGPDVEIVEILPFRDQYELEVGHFVAMVLDGAEPVIPVADSVDNALLLHAIRRSWSAGPVEMPGR